MSPLNEWNEQEVARAERTWGHKTPQYTVDMFESARKYGNSFIDLGCGFGRFLEFLRKHSEEPDYIGYDSSESMISRIKERFPEYHLRVFQRDITEPISHVKDVIISSAVFIHITIEEQNTILDNLLKIKPPPSAIIFDINCPSEREIDNLRAKGAESFERHLKTTKDGKTAFRMTWQSHYDMTRKVLKKFGGGYLLNVKFYFLKPNRHKVVYTLRRRTKDGSN